MAGRFLYFVAFTILSVGFCHGTSVLSDIRVYLGNGQTDRDGIVMTEHYGISGIVCGDHFGKKEADVTCRHLGYSSGEALCCQPYGEVHHSTRSAIKCHGNETSLHHCTRHFVNIGPLLGAWLGESTSNETKLLTKCEKHDYAAVVCHNSSAPSESGIHLSIAGPSSFTGRLVVTYDGVLGGVCGEGWNQQAADRACKDLGYNHGANYTHAHVVDAAAGPVWTANVSCDGAHSFAECKHAPLGSVRNCSHHAAVMCYNDFSHANKGYPYYSLEVSPAAKAAGGIPANSGLVRVFIDGRWGTISAVEQAWSQADLDVFCRSMGFSSGRILPSHTPPLAPGVGPVWKVALNCGGEESDLMHCKVKEGWSKAVRQDHTEDLQVTCSYSVALREGQTTHDGLVYIKASSFKHTGSQQTDKDWVPVVYENFDNKEAQVICRELGYAGGVSVCCGDRYPNVDTLDVDMATVASNCTGTERAFRDCAVVKSIGNVWNGVYASVSCFATVKSKEYVLSLNFNDVFDSYDYEDYEDYYYYDIEKLHNETWGSLVVLYNGVEGNICPDGWTDQDAQVACKELGYPHGQKYLHTSWYAGLQSIFWSSNFQCTGKESRLSECQHDGWGHTRTCRYAEAFAGVICYMDEGVKYRIFNPDPQATWGRVEVMRPETSTWATLCNEPSFAWSETEANVVCRMFGYKSGQVIKVAQLPRSQGPVYERYEDCQGHEDSLEHCVHEGFVPAYSNTCHRRNAEAGVFCTPYAPGEHPHKTTTTTTITTTTVAPKKASTTTKMPTITTTTTTTKPKTTTTSTTTTTTTTTTPKTTTTTPKTTTPTTTTTTTTRRPIVQTTKQPAPSSVRPQTLKPSTHNTPSNSDSGDDAKTKDQTKDSPSSSASISSSPSSSASISSSPSSSASISSSSSSSSSVDVGAIVGGVLGMIAVCGALVAGVMFWRRFTQHTSPRSPVGGIPNLVYDTRLDQIHLQPSV